MRYLVRLRIGLWALADTVRLVSSVTAFALFHARTRISVPLHRKSLTIRLSPFLLAPFPARIRILNRAAKRRLSSSELAAIWHSATVQASGLKGVPQYLLHGMAREGLQLYPDSAFSDYFWEFLLPTEISNGSDPGLVVLIVSCVKRLGQARSLCAALKAHSTPSLVVVASPLLKEAVLRGDLLIVPCRDDYDSLPTKVLESLWAVRRRWGSAPVIKLDDDAVAIGPADIGLLRQHAASTPYAGYINVVRPWQDRCWHIGKCRNIDLPYTGRFKASRYATGAVYLLNGDATGHLVQDYILYPDELRSQIYEDKTIGDMLFEYRIEPAQLDLGPLLGVKLDMNG